MAKKEEKLEIKVSGHRGAKAGARKLPKATRGIHLTTPEDRKLGRELAKAGLPTTVLKRKSRSTIDGASLLRHVHMLRSWGTHGSLAQHAKEDSEAYTAYAKATALEARLQRIRLERTHLIAAAVYAEVMRGAN